MLAPSYLRRARGRASVAAAARSDRATKYWFFIHYLVADRGPAAGREQVCPEPVQATREAATDEDKQQRLEAVLLIAPEELSSRKLAKMAGLADATEARTLIRRLNAQLDRDGAAYRVEEVAGGYTLLTRSQFAPWLRRLPHIPGSIRLSQSAIETLAVVAYRQPVLRANVEAIRGVGCSEVLKQLMELDLVRISGRSEELGRPYLYGTTRRFLQMFGLRSADRLPRIEWVNQPQLSLSSQELADTDSETKESTVKMNFAGTAILEEEARLDTAMLEGQTELRAAVDDDDDEYFDEEDDIDDEDDEFDDEDDFDDDDSDWEEDDDDDEEDDDDLDDSEEEASWEEVDDEDDEEEDEDDEEVDGADGDDWDDEDEDDWEEDEEDDDWD